MGENTKFNTKKNNTIQTVEAEIAANLLDELSGSLLEIGDTSLAEADEKSRQISVVTLSALLGSSYGMAFILAVIWVIVAWAREKRVKNDNGKTNHKKGSVNDRNNRNSNDDLSICSDN